MKVVSRKEALEQRLTYFFNGKKCKHGHIEDRYVSSYQCVVCAKNFNSTSDAKARQINWRREDRRKRSAFYNDKRKKWRKNLSKAERQAFDNKSLLRRKVYKLANADKIADYQRNRYLNGPRRPEGELQWLEKSRTMLRSVKRALRNAHPHEALRSLLKVFPPDSSLHP